MSNIAVVCGSFHKSEIERMLEWARDESNALGLDIVDVVWVPGAMEVPLAIDRLLADDDIEGVGVFRHHRKRSNATWFGHGTSCD
jgi:6,7-dimethyl-8-ribityllumazine synthase